MANLLTPFYRYSPAAKTLSVDSFPEEAWTTVHGDAADNSDLAAYYRSVAWLYRGVDLRVKGVAGMPFAIYKGRREITTSAEYENKTGWLRNPGRLFGQIEAALTIWGAAYTERRKNRAGGGYDLEYLLPSSIRAKIDRESGAVEFKRTVGGRQMTLTEADLVYWWAFDPWVEAGPPLASPAQASAAAAGVTLNVNRFAASFFQRGAIKATLLTTEGRVIEQERQRLKAWWQRMFARGTQTAWNTEIVNAEAVKAVQIGEGLESLENRELSEEKRMEIATALGVPHSILFSNAANYATSDQDDQNFAEDTVIPECEFIASVLNDQLFEPLGFRLEFQSEKLPMFQQDEGERGAALAQLVSALADPDKFKIAAAILGYEIPPEAQAMLDALEARRDEERERMAVQMGQAALGQPPPPEDERPGEADADEPQPSAAGKAADLDRWRRKAIKALKAGKSAAVEFVSEAIPSPEMGRITAALRGCKSAADVCAVFAGEPLAAPDAAAIVEAIRLGVEALKVEQSPAA